VLYFDRSGFCIWGKRLEAGKFISDWRAVHTREMDWTGLKLLLEGMEGKRFASDIRCRMRRKAYKSSTYCAHRDTMMTCKARHPPAQPTLRCPR
jgi:hypothetical protein